MYQIDCKNTIWYRYHVGDKKVAKELTEKIKSGEITDENEIRMFLEQKGIDIHAEYLEDTAENMSVDENGAHTVEVIDEGSGEILATNSL